MLLLVLADTSAKDCRKRQIGRQEYVCCGVTWSQASCWDLVMLSIEVLLVASKIYSPAPRYMKDLAAARPPNARQGSRATPTPTATGRASSNMLPADTFQGRAHQQATEIHRACSLYADSSAVTWSGAG
jgi:hypothetical protein